MSRILSAAVGLTLVLSAPAAAQDAPAFRGWAAGGYEHSRFAQDLDPWHLASVEAGVRGTSGALLLRGSVADRFGRTGRQVEVEAYPVLARGIYALIGAGASGGELFPRWLAAGEVFGSPVPGWEVSTGVRHLAFEPDAVTILTASVGVYHGPWYAVARPFVGVQEGGASVSGVVLARRALDRDDRSVGVRVGAGAVPTETFTEAEFARVGSLRVAAEGRTPVGEAVVLGLDLGWERETLPGDVRRSRVTLGVRVEHRFR